MAKLVKGVNDFKTWCNQHNQKSLLKEYSADNKFKPDEISWWSERSVKWVCPKCKNVWRESIKNRLIFDNPLCSECPKCLQKRVAEKRAVGFGYSEIISNPKSLNRPVVDCLSMDFNVITDNELQTRTELMNVSVKPFDVSYEPFFDYGIDGNNIMYKRIHYISDIHLIHKFEAYHCKTNRDRVKCIEKLVTELMNGVNKLLIINGDLSSDYYWFDIFIHLIYKYQVEHYVHCEGMKIIFILGNHEVWSFPNENIEAIKNHYIELFDKYNAMDRDLEYILLQNDLLYMPQMPIFRHVVPCIIRESELLKMSDEELKNRLSDDDLLIFGGMGFSGHNNDFNANNGIYRNVIDRNTEIDESNKCDLIYEKIKRVFRHSFIVATHMPIDCWANNTDCRNGVIYLSGHTHRNIYDDDGVRRFIADNQVGYKAKHLQSKYVDMRLGYDIFEDYEDGIYTISKEEYASFYRHLKHSVPTGRIKSILYMLKKNGYYCFIAKSAAKVGGLLIMNEGMVNRLPCDDINYYYSNMERMIEAINGPLVKYTELQKQISHEIQKIGGVGIIHGCIIDIEEPHPWSYNHIYLNPIDLTITPYFAYDIVNKYVYKNIPSLLNAELPHLYDNYKALLDSIGDKSNTILPAISVNNDIISKEHEPYYSTDIYKASKILKKMQKLDCHILTVWNDDMLRQTDKLLNEG